MSCRKRLYAPRQAARESGECSERKRATRWAIVRARKHAIAVERAVSDWCEAEKNVIRLRSYQTQANRAAKTVRRKCSKKVGWLFVSVCPKFRDQARNKPAERLWSLVPFARALVGIKGLRSIQT
jgi:hypothetical protein